MLHDEELLSFAAGVVVVVVVVLVSVAVCCRSPPIPHVLLFVQRSSAQQSFKLVSNKYVIARHIRLESAGADDVSSSQSLSLSKSSAYAPGNQLHVCEFQTAV